MSWDNAPSAAAGDNGWNGGGNDSSWQGTSEQYAGIDPEHVSKHDGLALAGDNTCRNCGQEGHFSRQCPDGPQNSGECYNCGETGHNKADCPNERVEREFTGECRLCAMVGHRAADCPSAGPKTCRRCKSEGHTASECTNAYNIFDESVADLDADSAWELLKVADDERDLDDFKKTLMSYCKSTPSLTLVDIEVALRETSMNTYLVAREQEVSSTHTIVDLQGKADCKYAITFQYGLQPRRPKNADAWPKTEEENHERLADAGFIMDRMIPKCRNCEELGHISKNCPEEKREVEKDQINCPNCKEIGHYLRDCPLPRVDRNTCRNCNQPGHNSKECTEPRSAENVECRKCMKMGHFSKDCPDAPKFECRNCGKEGHRAADCAEERKLICRNCDKEGHHSRECPEPKDWTRVECRNCGEKGHGAGRCKAPPKESDEEGLAAQGNGVSLSGFDNVGGSGGGGSWEAGTTGDSGAAGGGDAWGAATAAASTGGAW